MHHAVKTPAEGSNHKSWSRYIASAKYNVPYEYGAPNAPTLECYANVL